MRTTFCPPLTGNQGRRSSACVQGGLSLSGSGLSGGRIAFHAAARLRAAEFNYISLETVLSDAGVIPQVPINWISLMSSGRSHVVDCGDFGHIEFVHTAQRPGEISAELTYDPDCHLWRASVRQALRDMRATRRSMELLDTEALDEFV